MCPLIVNNIIYRILYYENRVTKIPVLYEITNEPYVSSNYENAGKTVTVDLTTSYDAETNTSLAEKIKNVCEHNFEVGANNCELGKDTDRSNLKSKVKYLS